jgi:hypothetical protein
MTDPNTIPRALQWVASIDQLPVLDAYAVAVKGTKGISAEFKAAVLPAVTIRRSELLRLPARGRR